MGQVCGICGGKAGFGSFRCRDGKICRKCYEVVSNQFTRTISEMSLEDLKADYERNKAPIDWKGFKATASYGTFLAVDENSRQILLGGNYRVTKEYSRPELLAMDDLENWRVVTKPALKEGDLKNLMERCRKRGRVDYLSIEIYLKDGSRREILVVPAPIKAQGYAFIYAFEMMTKMSDALAAVLPERNHE